MGMEIGGGEAVGEGVWAIQGKTTQVLCYYIGCIMMFSIR